MSGGRPNVHDDDEVLSVIRQSDLPVVGTSYVADQLGFSTNKGAADRLQKLVDKGLVNTAMVGPTRIWWIPEDDE